MKIRHKYDLIVYFYFLWMLHDQKRNERKEKEKIFFTFTKIARLEHMKELSLIFYCHQFHTWTFILSVPTYAIWNFYCKKICANKLMFLLHIHFIYFKYYDHIFNHLLIIFKPDNIWLMAVVLPHWFKCQSKVSAWKYRNTCKTFIPQ